MSLRFTVIALAGVLLLAPGGVSTANAQLLGSRPLALPITGSVSGGATFTGTVNIRGFAVRQGATVAIAAITGAVVDAAGVQARTGMQASLVLPVEVSAGAGAGSAAYRPFDRNGSLRAPGFVRVSQACGAAHIEIGATTVNVMGVAVTLNPAVIDVGADSGGTIGSLVCQILSLVGNPTMLVSLLNSLLPLLGGLLGGATGILV
jgi:hypothetical protein